MGREQAWEFSYEEEEVRRAKISWALRLYRGMSGRL